MAKETSRGYNPVTRPNPQVDPAHRPTGVMSQFDGNIRPDIMGVRNVRWADDPGYTSEMDDDEDDET